MKSEMVALFDDDWRGRRWENGHEEHFE